MSPETTIAERTASLRLTEACWPILEFVINFSRQAKAGAIPPPEQLRYEAISALRDSEDRAREDPITERAWADRVKAIMVYLVDYKLVTTQWEGNTWWYQNRFETDPEVLGHVESLGGDKFFEDCDELQREYETAERRDRRDKDELAEQLGLYFICLRLGFKGRYHDRPQELADYTRRLYSRLPAYAATRGKEMFPEAYRHNQELKVDYKLGMSLTIVLITLAVIVGAWLIASRVAWSSATAAIEQAAGQWSSASDKPPSAGGRVAK